MSVKGSVFELTDKGSLFTPFSFINLRKCYMQIRQQVSVCWSSILWPVIGIMYTSGFSVSLDWDISHVNFMAMCHLCV
jgi:hypothetical protein